MTTLTHSAMHRRPAASSLPADVLRHVRRSRSLASMLPALLSSGVMTLVAAAVMHLMWDGLIDGFAGRWMESWLTAWPIAFPVAYLVVPALAKLAARFSAPAAQFAPHEPGLDFGDIEEVSKRVTAQNGCSVLRNLKPAHDFSAV
jgi:hypothetical protein